jgi:HEAT repeat protein
MIASATTSPNTGPIMRRFALLALFALVLAATGCGKKPAPAPPPDEPAPGLNPPADTAATERKKYIAGLKTANQETRRTAVEELSWLAEDDPAVVPALIEMLRDKNTGGTGRTLTNQINSAREAAALAILKCTNGEKIMAEKGIPVLREELSSPTPLIREHTAHTVGRLGTLAKPLAADIQKLCLDPDANVRSVAFDTLRVTGVADPAALAKMLHDPREDVVRLAAELIPVAGPMPEAGIAALVEALKNDNTNVQYAAATGLGLAGPKAGAAAPVVAEAINKFYPKEYDPMAARTESVEGAYWQALARLGEASVAPTTKLLDHTNMLVRMYAARALGEIGAPAKSAKDALKKALADSTIDVSSEAAVALCKLGESEADAVALIKRAIEFPERGVARVAIQCVPRMGAAGKELVPLALAKMGAANENTRYAAVWLVGELPAAEAGKAAAEVGKRATDQFVEVRRLAGRVLERMGPAAAPAAESLGTALATEKDAEVRDLFIEALASMGAGAKPAVAGLLPQIANRDLTTPMRAKVIAAVAAADPTSAEVAAALVKAADDTDAGLRVAAAGALGGLNPLPADALAALVKMAKGDRTNNPRVAALRALTAAGPRAKGAKPDLEALAGGQQPHLALWAKVALAALNGDANAAAPVVRAGLGDRNALVRSSAAEALLVIGPTAADLPALLKVMRDAGSSTKIASATAAGRLGAAAKDAVPELRRMLDHTEDDVCAAAADALGRIGPAALPAVAKLKEVAPRPAVRLAAQKAIEKIEGK